LVWGGFGLPSQAGNFPFDGIQPLPEVVKVLPGTDSPHDQPHS
jgi:hypothetical protein